MAKFLSYLVLRDITDDVSEVRDPLVFDSDILGRIEVKAGFQTDKASVPRVPLVYEAWGDKAHYESVIHDWLYCIDSVPQATFSQANDVFLEAMAARGKSWWIRYPMYWGVCMGGKSSYHKRKVDDALA
jgi:hypothetical protein